MAADLCDGLVSCGAALFKPASAPEPLTAAFPPGLPAEGHKAALIEARGRGLQVILASHGGAGRVIENRWMRTHDFVAADSLAPKKARILAMLVLARGGDATVLRRAFAEY